MTVPANVKEVLAEVSRMIAVSNSKIIRDKLKDEASSELLEALDKVYNCTWTESERESILSIISSNCPPSVHLDMLLRSLPQAKLRA